MSRAVLITGASRGIGRATAIAFARRGDRVAVHHRDSATLAEKLVADLPGAGHVVVQADVADPEAVRTMVDQAAQALGGIDVLVNNAGVFTPHRITEVSYEQWQAQWRRTVDVNLIGVRLEADVSDKGCTNGKLGGGITVDEFHSKVLPALAAGLDQVVKANDPVASTILKLFDADQNGTISADELENNLLLKLAIFPDLDLLDASGKFNPRQDGVADSMSFGVGFACAPAIFTAPGE